VKKRVAIGVGIALVVGIAVAVWLLLSRLDSLVARVIEAQGSRIAGSAVRVGSVHIDLREGRGTIRGLRVANPPGFSSGDAFELGEIALDIDTRSLGGRPIAIDELRVEEPVAHFEVDAKGRSNFEVLRQHAESASAGEAAAPGPAEPASGESTRLRIGRFALEGGRVRADVSALDPKREPIEAPLPPIRLRDVGGPRGATPGEIGKTLLTAFTGSVVRTVAGSQLGSLLERQIGGEAGKAASGLLKHLLDQPRGQGADAP
jgi:hypothetical protein